MEELKIRYGRIPGYRDPSRKSWGFTIEGGQEALGYGVYTSARRSARKTLEKIRAHAKEQGYSLKLTLDEGCGLRKDLTPERAVGGRDGAPVPRPVQPSARRKG